MGDRENTGRQSQEPNRDPQPPLPPAGTPTTPNPQDPHGGNIHPRSHRQPHHSEHWFHNPDWWMVILTGLAFAVAGATLIVFYRQFREMKTQTGILNAQAQQAATDAVEAGKNVQKQIEIAQASVKAIQKQMRQDQRAWLQLGLLEDESTTTYEPDKPMEIPLKIVNVGKTPALRLVYAAEVEIVPKDQAPTLKYSYFHGTNGMVYRDKSIHLTAQTNATNRKQERSDVRPLGRKDYADLSTGRAYVVYFGKVDYWDIFGVKHWTHFCGWKMPVPVGESVPAKKCSDYNGADNN